MSVSGNAVGAESSKNCSAVTLFLCGDVMTGRGIDQILPHAGDPRIYEPYVDSALGYVELAERSAGPIPRPVDFRYVWGDALEELRRTAPDAKIVNLETSVTASDEWVPKGINYRMHPDNTPCITAAGIDCCVLANNHVLDWGYAGLEETLQSLERGDLLAVGAGRNIREAQAPAVIDITGKARVLVYAFGSVSSGIPPEWAATEHKPGVNLLSDLSDKTVRDIAQRVLSVKRSGDIVVASIHWGGNWGYRISAQQTKFARKLIDLAGVDVIHGHSSHHPKGIEVYRQRPIIYGCGDFLNDYEGIGGYEAYRGDLALMYFVRVEPATGALAGLEMTPVQIKRFRLTRATPADARWLARMLSREGSNLGTSVNLDAHNRLALGWR